MTHPVVEAAPGITRQVLADDPALMLVAVHFAHAGAEGVPHAHPHVQTTYVQSGRFRFRLGAETFELGPGDSLLVPSGVEHGCLCLEPGSLLDAFAPHRADFL